MLRLTEKMEDGSYQASCHPEFINDICGNRKSSCLKKIKNCSPIGLGMSFHIMDLQNH